MLDNSPHNNLAFGAFPASRIQRLAADLGGILPDSRLGRRAAALLRSCVRRSNPGTVDAERLGFKIRLHLRDNACERRLFVTPHYFEPAEVCALRSRVHPEFNFVDVGANVGIYSLLVGHWSNATANILAIEPQPILCQRLRDNIALNGFGIRVAQSAVSDQNGRLLLHVNERNVGNSGAINKSSRDEMQVCIEVPCSKLLDLIVQHGFERIDALKIDIEGHETHALAPFLKEAPQCLWPKLLIIETHDNGQYSQLLDKLNDMGWRDYRPSGNSKIFLRQ